MEFVETPVFTKLVLDLFSDDEWTVNCRLAWLNTRIPVSLFKMQAV